MPVPADIALDSAAVQTALQSTVIAVLGGLENNSTVRCGYQQQGQPSWKITADVCVILATEEDDEYNRNRDVEQSQFDATHVLFTTTYTRVWLVHFNFYGPNAFTRARLTKSGMYTQFTHDLLVPSNLYMVTDTQGLTRAPEVFQSQYWERVDWKAKFNEAVTEYLLVQTVKSTEVKLYTSDDGLVKDFTVTGS